MEQAKHDREQLEQMMRISEEIREALEERESANRYFDYATGKEQVDYAVHAIITAEKRYAMLMERAKRMTGKWPQWGGLYK